MSKLGDNHEWRPFDLTGSMLALGKIAAIAADIEDAGHLLPETRHNLHTLALQCKNAAEIILSLTEQHPLALAPPLPQEDLRPAS